MSRPVVVFVAAVVVFAAATVGFAQGGGSDGLLSNSERLDIEFSANDGIDEFDVVEQSLDTTGDPSSGPDATDDGDTTKDQATNRDDEADGTDSDDSELGPGTVLPKKVVGTDQSKQVPDGQETDLTYNDATGEGATDRKTVTGDESAAVTDSVRL
jgi:hypothetical protein